MRGLTLVIAGAVLLLAMGCGAPTVKITIGTPSPDAVYAIKEGIHAIDIAVRSYAVDNNDVYPEPSLVNESGLADYVSGNSPWPTNPYTDQPMSQGTGPGDYAYTLSADAFELVGYGEGGKAVFTVPVP